MTAETVTLDLDETVYRTASRLAELTGQPLNNVLRASIAHALPPLEDLSVEEAAELADLALQDDGALWRVARSELAPADQTALRDLLDRQGDGTLDEPDAARLQELLDLYGQRTVRKAHAYLLLARRGYRVPMQEDASAAS